LSGASHREWPPAWARGLEAGEAGGEALYLALEAGGWPGALDDAQRRAFALVVMALLDSRQQGATRLPLAKLGDRLARLGGNEANAAAAAALSLALAHGQAPLPLAPYVGRPGDYKPFIVDGDYLYAERELRLEEQLATSLARRLRMPVDLAAAAPVSAPPGLAWTDEQAAAIDAACRRRFVAISGGPGSGKTAVIDGIVRAWSALGIPRDQIAIAAPTGKAANRIAELLPAEAPTPRTLHRLLGYAVRTPGAPTGDFRHHENHPLPHAAVIVDEASMVGLALMSQLIRALRPDARLVLIGDADQLPAVEVGNVLADLRPHAVRLTGSHRMNPGDPAGAAVLRAANAIARGELGDHGTPPVRTAAALGDAGFLCLDPGTPAAQRRTLAEFLEHWVARRVRALPDDDGTEGGRRVFPIGDGGLRSEDVPGIAALLAHHQRARVLTVTRAAADRINQTLLRRVSPAAAAGALPPGTPVMMTHNDYDRGLYNGDQGIVLRVTMPTGGTTLAAVFAQGGGALTPFALGSFDGALAIAYATTVHKAQGSELDHGALVLPETDSPILSRELVYTAVTRVRRSIVVVGDRALLASAVARPLDRSSGLRERMIARGAMPRG
jgi:exodeoxyribonuclease V alpha subunit